MSSTSSRDLLTFPPILAFCPLGQQVNPAARFCSEMVILQEKLISRSTQETKPGKFPSPYNGPPGAVGIPGPSSSTYAGLAATTKLTHVPKLSDRISRGSGCP